MLINLNWVLYYQSQKVVDKHKKNKQSHKNNKNYNHIPKKENSKKDIENLELLKIGKFNYYFIIFYS